MNQITPFTQNYWCFFEIKHAELLLQYAFDLMGKLIFNEMYMYVDQIYEN